MRIPISTKTSFKNNKITFLKSNNYHLPNKTKRKEKQKLNSKPNNKTNNNWNNSLNKITLIPIPTTKTI